MKNVSQTRYFKATSPKVDALKLNRRFYIMAVKTYTVEEIAKQLDISPRTVREYIRKGKLKAVKVGNKYIISEDNYRHFVNGD